MGDQATLKRPRKSKKRANDRGHGGRRRGGGRPKVGSFVRVSVSLEQATVAALTLKQEKQGQNRSEAIDELLRKSLRLPPRPA